MSIIESIKLLFKVKGPAQELIGEIKEAKTGWKTLNFWVSVLATFGTIAAAVTGFIPATTGVIITTAITVVYNIVRAIQNADMSGVTPIFLSTRFWMGILGIVSTGLISLKTGGIDPAWLETAIGIIAAIMAAAQNIGAQQPPETPSAAPVQ